MWIELNDRLVNGTTLIGVIKTKTKRGNLSLVLEGATTNEIIYATNEERDVDYQKCIDVLITGK